MSIATSIEKLSETLTNCKANLKEKEVADVDNIKISDVDEKIAEIQAGGGGGFNWIEKVEAAGKQVEASCVINLATMDAPAYCSVTFTPKEDNLTALISNYQLSLSPQGESSNGIGSVLKKGTEYTVSGSTYNTSFLAVFNFDEANENCMKNADCICFNIR